MPVHVDGIFIGLDWTGVMWCGETGEAGVGYSASDWDSGQGGISIVDPPPLPHPLGACRVLFYVAHMVDAIDLVVSFPQNTTGTSYKGK